MVFVGNIMIDTLESNRKQAAQLKIEEIIKINAIEGQEKELNPNGKFAIVTLHRPSNVDQKEILEPIIRLMMDEFAKDMSIIWPIHPRTLKQLKTFGLWEEILNHPQMLMQYPLGYHELLRLNMDASMMLTDSGGLQEECTILGTPCTHFKGGTPKDRLP